LTGGALAKLAVKAPLGNGLVGLLTAISAAGTTLLMVHFLLRLTRGSSQAAQAAAAPAGLAVHWLTMALASLLVPWLMYPVLWAAMPARGLPLQRS
jgi:multicomponent Na+:H+ antiporter subunit A